MFTRLFLWSKRASAVGAPANGTPFEPGNCQRQYLVALMLAILTTSTSLAIAMYAGWQRGGLPVERAMIVTLAGVSVLYVHLLPTGWRVLSVPARLCAFAMWCMSVVIVLHGQVTFFMVSQQHAGNLRASAVPATVVPSGIGAEPGRSRTEIAQNIAKVSAALARANTRSCPSDCPTQRANRTILVAELTALNTEADEAKRREVEVDRLHAQADRVMALRESYRADPVTSRVAVWLNSTEARLNLLLAVACAVVLEGAACMCWYFAAVAGHSSAIRGAIATGRGQTVLDSMLASETHSSDVLAAGGTKQLFGDDLLLEQIHEAAVEGHLKPTQAAIRKHLQCGQQKAGQLNRLYAARFGNAGSCRSLA